MKTSKFHYKILEKKWEVTSFCMKCNSWVHKKCSGVQKCLSKAVDFMCRNYSGIAGDVEGDGDVTLDSD